MVESKGSQFKPVETPFTKALRELASDRGFESLLSISEPLDTVPIVVSRWKRGLNVPSPKHFGEFLILCQPHDEKLEDFIEAYAQEISSGKGVAFGGWRQGWSIDVRLKISERKTKSSIYPIGRWIEKYCAEKRITLRQFNTILGLYPSTDRNSLGLDTLNKILQNAQPTLNLSQEQTKVLSEAVVQTKQQKLEEGHRFQDGPIGIIVTKMQESLDYKTYNGAEAARELGVSREFVSKKRKKYNWQKLMTEEQFNILREDFDKTKDWREKRKGTKEQVIFESDSLGI